MDPASAQTPPPASSSARSHFHVALTSAFVPGLGLLVVWVLALSNLLRRAATPDHRRWAHRLATLAVVDLLATLAFLALYARLNSEPRALSGPVARTAPGPRIGILFDPSRDEPRVEEVMADWPAARAGLRSGDLIVAIDDQPVSTRQEVQDRIVRTPEGSARRLTIARGGELVEAEVVPERPNDPGKVNLFEVRKGERELRPTEMLVGLLAYLPAVLVVGLAWLRGRTSVRRLRVWRGVFVAMIGSAAVGLGAVYGLKATLGGLSTGIVLIGLLAGSLSMVLLTALVRGWLSEEASVPPDVPAYGPIRTYLQGLFYAVTGLPRLALLLGAVDVFVFGSEPGLGSGPMEALAGGKLGPLGATLFAGAAVIGAPLGEEMLFRGFILPRLALQLGKGWALGASSVLFGLFHPHYGLYVPIIVFYGWIFGWARLRSGGIGASVALHMTANGAAFVLLLFR